MSKLSIVLLLVVTSATAVAAELDPAYIKTFGQPAISASISGFPALAGYKADQFDYRDGVFYTPGGEDMTLDLRAVMAPGMTIAKALAKTKKDRGKNLKFHKGDFLAFRIWISHDQTNRKLVTDERPWPKKLSDIPIFDSPKVSFRTPIGQAQADWVGAVYAWQDLKVDALELKRALKGTRFYVTFHIGFEYKTPGGQIEHKWNDVLKRWEPRKSLGLVGFEYGDPLAACTIEVAGLQGDASRFKAEGDGIKDVRSGLTWSKKADVKRRKSDVPGAQTVDAYVASLGGGWRLPTKAELVAMRKAGGEKPTEFFATVGFAGVQSDCYWSSEPSNAGRWICVTMAHEEYKQPVRDAVRHADATDPLPVWVVK